MDGEGIVRIQSHQFGEIEVVQDELLLFQEGLVGFSHLKTFALLESSEVHPFVWLQSIEDPSVAFVIIDPLLVVPDYQVQVHPEDLEGLELADPADAKVLAIVVVPSDPQLATMNLKGPLVINPNSRRGKQIVLADPGYSTQHPLWHQTARQEGQPCSS